MAFMVNKLYTTSVCVIKIILCVAGNKPVLFAKIQPLKPKIKKSNLSLFPLRRSVSVLAYI